MQNKKYQSLPGCTVNVYSSNRNVGPFYVTLGDIYIHKRQADLYRVIPQVHLAHFYLFNWQQQSGVSGRDLFQPAT